MNCGDPSMENRFQVVKFSSFFVWCKMPKGSLGLPILTSESVLSGPVRLTVTASCEHGIPKKYYGQRIFMQKKSLWPPWTPHFHDFHILTASLEEAKLDIIHSCQLH